MQGAWVQSLVRELGLTCYPQYVLNESLCYSVYESINFKNAISVSDCFDGDLSNSMILTSNDYTSSAEGVFTIDATVTSSKGDTATISLPFIVENRETVVLFSFSEYPPVHFPCCHTLQVKSQENSLFS